LWRQIGVESINILKVWRSGIESSAVNYRVTIVPDPNVFVTEGDEALYVVRIRNQDCIAAIGSQPSVDIVSVKHNDLSAFRALKIVDHAVDEEMIATHHL
jgi:hypothetical protein